MRFEQIKRCDRSQCKLFTEMKYSVSKREYKCAKYDPNSYTNWSKNKQIGWKTNCCIIHGRKITDVDNTASSLWVQVSVAQLSRKLVQILLIFCSFDYFQIPVFLNSPLPLFLVPYSEPLFMFPSSRSVTFIFLFSTHEEIFRCVWVQLPNFPAETSEYPTGDVIGTQHHPELEGQIEWIAHNS